MSSRQQSLGAYEIRPARFGGAWTPLFVVALAAFLGSLIMLTVTIFRIPGHRSAGAVMQHEDAAVQPAIAAGARPINSAPKEPILEIVGSAPAWEDTALRRAIESALGSDLEHTSVAVQRLGDGRSASVNSDFVYYAASTFKLAILYEAERRSSVGELDLDALVYFSDADLREDLGTLGSVAFEPDGGVRIRGALEAMISYSDNSSAVALLHLLGGAAIDESLRALGLTTMSVNTEELPVTAADLGLLIRAIVEGSGVTEAARDEMRRFLLNQRTREGIPAGLPRGVRVGNKTGTWAGATHDVAFVEAPGGMYVITVLSDEGWNWNPIVRVSEAVFGEMQRGR